MKALGYAGQVPLQRVLEEHRTWVLPVAALLLINVIVLVAVVLPASNAAAAAESRAAAADAALQQTERDYATADATRQGQQLATTELQTFYTEVLPANIRAAGRLTHVRIAQLADKHDIRYERMAADPERVRDSALERMKVTMELSGDYADVRAFLHELETARDFVVIDNMVLGSSEGGQGLTLSLELSTYYLANANGG